MNAAVQPDSQQHPAILKAIRLIGSERKLARILGVSRTWVYLVRNCRERVSAEMAVRLSDVTANKVRRSELRPDLWGRKK